MSIQISFLSELDSTGHLYNQKKKKNSGLLLEACLSLSSLCDLAVEGYLVLWFSQYHGSVAAFQNPETAVGLVGAQLTTSAFFMTL